MKIEIISIVVDEHLYPRAKVDAFNVQRLMHAFNSGALFPDIVVEAGTHRLVDGRHRLEVYRAKGITAVEAIEKVYPNDADLFADAVRLNIGHGAPLDQFSVRTAVARLIEYGFERAAIQEIVRLPTEHLERVVKGFASTPAGETIALKGGLRHMRGEQLTEEQVEVNRRYGGGKAEFYARQIVGLLETDMAPRSPAFSVTMDRLVDLWLDARKAAKKRGAA